MVDLLEIYCIIGDGRRINMVDPERTARIMAVIKDITDINQLASCIRAFLSYYPDDSLLEFCFQRLFDEARPQQSSGPKYNLWKQTLTVLATALCNCRIEKWTSVLQQKIMTYCPELADEIWKDAVPSEADR